MADPVAKINLALAPQFISSHDFDNMDTAKFEYKRLCGLKKTDLKVELVALNCKTQFYARDLVAITLVDLRK